MKKRTQLIATVFVALPVIAVLVPAQRADAFPTGFQFDGSALTSDSGGGISFDGTPRYQSHTCIVCHTDTPNLVSLSVNSDHPELFTGGWVPSMQYVMQVVLLNEHEGTQFTSFGDNCGLNATPYVPCNDNGFALEVDTGTGQPVGTYALFDPSAMACAGTGSNVLGADAYVLTDGTAVAHSGAHHAQASWKFCWTAPQSGAGTLSIYAAVVDGGSGNGSAFPDTTTGDDAFSGVVQIPEVGTPPPPPQTGGCDSGGDSPGAAVGLAALIVVVTLRRRSVTAVAVAAQLTATMATACTHVRATQREVLARKNMTFGPDPLEDELDLHMQEAREGSSGGYGSSGGGCGCN